MYVYLHTCSKSREVCIKARSPPAFLAFKGEVSEQKPVKWSIVPQVKCINAFITKKLDFIFTHVSVQIHIYSKFQAMHSQVTMEPKKKIQVALHNTNIQPIFKPLTFYTFLILHIKDALLYLKCLFLDTFYDESQKSQMELLSEFFSP